MTRQARMLIGFIPAFGAAFRGTATGSGTPPCLGEYIPMCSLRIESKVSERYYPFRKGIRDYLPSAFCVDTPGARVLMQKNY